MILEVGKQNKHPNMNESEKKLKKRNRPSETPFKILVNHSIHVINIATGLYVCAFILRIRVKGEKR